MTVIGRPSTYNPTVAAEVVARIAAGESLVAITADPSMPSRRTAQRWLRRYPDFRHNVDAARKIAEAPASEPGVRVLPTQQPGLARQQAVLRDAYGDATLLDRWRASQDSSVKRLASIMWHCAPSWRLLSERGLRTSLPVAARVVALSRTRKRSAAELAREVGLSDVPLGLLNLLTHDDNDVASEQIAVSRLQVLVDRRLRHPGEPLALAIAHAARAEPKRSPPAPPAPEPLPEPERRRRQVLALAIPASVSTPGKQADARPAETPHARRRQLVEWGLYD